MKTKKQLKLYMRKYLSNPENRAAHNNYSKAYFSEKYKASPKFRKATAKRAADWFRGHSKLVRGMYADLRYILSKES